MPTRPLLLAAFALSGCSLFAEPPPSFPVGGTLSGLSGAITLQNNGADDLPLSADGRFTFATQLKKGTTYAVTVFSAPSGQRCTVTKGEGTVSAEVTDVEVRCV